MQAHVVPFYLNGSLQGPVKVSRGTKDGQYTPGKQCLCRPNEADAKLMIAKPAQYTLLLVMTPRRKGALNCEVGASASRRRSLRAFVISSPLVLATEQHVLSSAAVACSARSTHF
jgi:hypothetical protein